MKDRDAKSIREVVRGAFSITEDTASYDEIRDRLMDGGRVTGTNLCMMACANAIACIGLNAGSMVTCVGAMLLEPLMGSVLLISYGMVEDKGRKDTMMQPEMWRIVYRNGKQFEQQEHSPA